MEINKIILSGFRNVDRTVLDLKDIIALVSTNNYGKSNVLTGIRLGIDFINFPRVAKEFFMRWPRVIPLNKRLDLENFKFEIETTTEIENTTFIIQYGYEFKWYRNDGTGQKIVGEYLKFKKKEDKKFTLYIDRNEKDAFYKSSDTGRCTTRININKNELIVNKLEAFDNLYYIDIINRLNCIKFHIERHLDASKTYEFEPNSRKYSNELDLESITYMPKVIYNLKKEHEAKYKLLINSFIQLFPEIRDIEVIDMDIQKRKKMEELPFELSNKIYTIMVYDKNLNQPINFENMSDGAKRIFLQLATIILAEIQGYSFVAIEEPENSIHPSLFQSYLRIISQFKGDCKIIITSHSPYLLKYLKSENIYIGVPNNYGIAKFSHIKKSSEKQLEKISRQYDISIGDYIFELLNGNQEDMDELKELLEVQE